MESKFKVDITVKDMFSFLINNTYRKLMGIIWIIFSIAVVVVAVITWGDINLSQSILLIVIACLYTIINPIMLYFKAKKQVKNNDYFGKALEYTVDSKGIKVDQDGESAMVKWEEMWKIVHYGSIVVVYITNIRAFIWPMRCIEDNYNTISEIATTGLGSRNHLRKKK